MAEREGRVTNVTYESDVQGLEKLKKFTEKKMGYWTGRDLIPLLEYDEWRNFRLVIDKAIAAYRASEMSVSNHFVETNNMVLIGAQRSREDWFLTKYACYLIAIMLILQELVLGMLRRILSLRLVVRNWETNNGD